MNEFYAWLMLLIWILTEIKSQELKNISQRTPVSYNCHLTFFDFFCLGCNDLIIVAKLQCTKIHLTKLTIIRIMINEIDREREI